MKSVSFVAGKKYVFDIKRTCREAYDHARRRLYAQGQPTSPEDVSATSPSPGDACTTDHVTTNKVPERCTAKCQVKRTSGFTPSEIPCWSE